MEEILQGLLAHSPDKFRRHIEFILEQLNSTQEEADAPSDDEEDDHDVDEPDDEDVSDLDILRKGLCLWGPRAFGPCWLELTLVSPLLVCFRVSFCM